MTSTILRKPVAFAVALSVLAGAGAAEAAIDYVGGTGTTVYGVAPYGGAQNFGAPTFIANNLSGFNDILASPGGGFLTANPIVDNNIFQTPLDAALPLYSFQTGGGNGFGPFGAGQTLINGPDIGFTLADFAAGGGSASYSISTWTANFTVDAGGFDGSLGNYLAVAGQVSDPGSAVAVSLISHYYLNDVLEGSTAPLVLAAANNGNFQAIGASGAFMAIGPGGGFRGLASNAFTDNFAFDRDLAGGDRLSVVSTLTAYADPAAFDIFFHIQPPDPPVTLPDFAFSAVRSGTPEPSTWAMMLLGFGGLGAMLRRRRSAAPASA